MPSDDRIIKEVKEAFLSKDIETLEHLSTKFRMENRKSPIGRWNLEHFYAGTRTAMAAMAASARHSDASWKEIEGFIKQWIKAYPKSPTAHIVYARALILHGWFFRGSGAASTVSKADWSFFYRYINRAHDHLQKAKTFASNDPRWYGVMMTVARAQRWKRGKFENLLSEAFHRYPYFYANYFSALQYFLPAWNGNIDQVSEFIDWAVKKTMKSDGMGIYARLYWRVSLDQYDDIFGKTNVDWEKMKDGFEDIVKQYPDPWNINTYARFAYLAGDKTKGQELSSRIAQKPILEAWRLGSFWPFWNWVRSLKSQAFETCRPPYGHAGSSKLVDFGNYGDITIGEYDRVVKYGESFIVTIKDISSTEGPRVKLKIKFGFQECNGTPADDIDLEVRYGRIDVGGGVLLTRFSHLSFFPREIKKFSKNLSFPRHNGVLTVRINTKLSVKESFYDNNDRVVQLKFVGFE